LVVNNSSTTDEPGLLARSRQILEFIEPSRYRVWAAYIAVGLLIGLLEACAGVLFLGLLATINGAGESVGRIAGLVRGVTGGMEPTIGMALLVILVYLVKNIAVLAQVYLRSSCGDGAFVGLSRRLLSNYLGAPYEFHLTRHSAELVKNINFSIELIAQSVLLGIASIVGEVFVVLGLFLVAVFVSPVLTLGVLVVLCFYVFVLSALTRDRVRALGSEQQVLAKENQRFLARTFDVLKEIKINGMDAAFVDAYAQNRARQALLLRRYEMFRIVPGVTAELLLVTLVAGSAIVIVLAGRNDPSLVAVVGLFAYLALRLKPSATRIALGLNGIRYGLGAVDIVSADLRIAHEAPRPSGPQGVSRSFETIELREVSYRYPGGERLALSGVSLTIRRGEMIGVIGSSGSGKSTFAEVLLGLLEPTTGTLLVDGRAVGDNRDGWYSGLAYVPQAVAILDDSIRRNIAFGVANADVDEARLNEVVRLAQLEDVVAALPRGLDTILGERGLGLSGGQRQRVAIARALYRNPRILIFDEATSGLDLETERDLTAAIERLHGSVTMVIVAHRLDTLRKCDRLVRFERGAVVAQGGFDAVTRDAPPVDADLR